MNLLFMAYLWLLQPLFLARLSATPEPNQRDWLAGLLLLLVPLFELVGIFLKRPVSAYLSIHYPRKEWSSWGFLIFLFTAMFHMAAAVMLVIIAFSPLQIGFDEKTSAGLQTLMFVVFMLTLFKEAFFIVFIFPSSTSSLFQYLYQNKVMNDQDRALLRWLDLRPPQQITLGCALRNLLGEICILVSSALLYTGLWEFILGQNPVDTRWPGVLSEYLGVSIFFLMVFLTVRAVGALEGLSIQSTPAQQRWSLISGAAIWLVTLLTLPRR